MGLDVLSPIAVAQVNVLVIPADNVKRSRFENFVSRLKEVYEVQLSDLSPNGGLDLFSPTPFPSGRLFLRFSTSERPTSMVDSFPFELNREPQVVLTVADGETLLASDDAQHGGNGSGSVAASKPLQSLLTRLEDLKS